MAHLAFFLTYGVMVRPLGIVLDIIYGDLLCFFGVWGDAGSDSGLSLEWQLELMLLYPNFNIVCKRQFLLHL